MQAGWDRKREAVCWEYRPSRKPRKYREDEERLSYVSRAAAVGPKLTPIGNSCFKECGTRGIIFHCLWEYELLYITTMEINIIAPLKVGNQSTSIFSYTTLRHIPKGCSVLQGHLLSHIHF